MIIPILAVSFALFQNPPPACGPHAWWHWMNGNVTREGVTADLEAMAAVGVAGAQIFDAGCDIPRGPVAFNTAAWYDLVEHAVREADRLGLRLGLSNCSGWSSSGGPWITPANAMKKTVFTVTRVTNGVSRIVLAQPETNLGFYRDVRVVALPAEPSGPARPYGEKVTIRSQYTLTLDAGRPVSPKGFAFRIGLDEIWTAWSDLTVEVSDDGRAYRKIQNFPFVISESRVADKSYRFRPFAPDVAARFFRFTMSAPWQEEPFLADVRLADRPAISEVAGKSFVTRNTLFPMEVPKGYAAPAVAKKDVLDLTDRLHADGSLDWTPPDGVWEIVRFGFTPTGEKTVAASVTGAGLECDKLSAKGVDAHFDACLKPLLERLDPKLVGRGKALDNILVDSYEVGPQNWTEGLETEFERRCGCSLVPFLPVFTGRIVGSLDESERVLTDFRRLVADLFAENYAGRLAARCHAYGLDLAIEPYGNGCFDDFRYAECGDVLMGEAWNGGKPFGNGIGCARFPASLQHVCGRRIVGMETFTCGFGSDGGRVHPWCLKAQADKIYAAGVNRISYHTFAHQPWTDPKYSPGMTMGPWGVAFNRGQTWFRSAREWIRYQTRVQYLLQEGVACVDALIVQPDIVPNGGESGERQANLGSLPYGYSRDWCGATQINRLKRGADGCLRTATAVYARTIKAGEGVSALGGLKPDFICQTALESKPVFIHRRYEDGTDGYFVALENKTNATVSVSFRLTGRSPELWNPETGARTLPRAWWTEDSRRTRVILDFTPAGSWFVMFPPKETAGLDREKSWTVTQSAAIDAPWKVSFEATYPPPAPVEMKRLENLALNANPDIRYFAGTATYRTTCACPKVAAGGRLVLDLGEVHELAEVTVNGRTYPTLWKPPYRVDVTEAARGKETLDLAVRVTTLWPNRLIGDEQLPEDCEWTPHPKGRGFAIREIPAWVREGGASPTGRKAFTTWKQWKKTDPLLPSGLVGPVRFEVERDGHRIKPKKSS